MMHSTVIPFARCHQPPGPVHEGYPVRARQTMREGQEMLRLARERAYQEASPALRRQMLAERGLALV